MNINQTQTETALGVRDLQRRMTGAEPVCLIDVRTPGEYFTAHVPGARLLPLDDLDAAAFRRERNGDHSPVYVLCQTGSRARRAIDKLAKAGLEACVLVEGGTQAWIDAGLPVTRGPSRVLPLMRQVQVAVGSLSALGALLALTVNPFFAAIPLVTGCGLLIAGLTGFCGLALVLAKMPWNKSSDTHSNSCCTKESK